MNEVYFVERSPDYLEHHGILGQKWGIRRFQNPDGSLTEEGRKRYGDILTPDQMKNMIKSYNLRTGKNKKINKNTTFKTSHGTYDYKGKRIDTDTNIEDPGNKEKPEYNTKKKPSEMTDEELEYATARQKAERLYKEEYAKNNPTPPEKISNAKQFMNNLRDDMVDTIPRSIAAGVGGYITKSLTNLANDSSGGQQKQQNQQNNQQQNQNKQQSQPKPQDQPQQNQNKQSKPQAPKEEPKEKPQPESTKETKSEEKKDSRPYDERLEEYFDKTSEKVKNVAKVAGSAGNQISTGVSDVAADAKNAYKEGKNYTWNQSVKKADKAIRSLNYTPENNPEVYNAAMQFVTKTVMNNKGREYRQQSTFDRLASESALQTQRLIQIRNAANNKPVSSIPDSSANVRSLFSSGSSNNRTLSANVLSTNVNDISTSDLTDLFELVRDAAK